ncbi:MAG: cold shock domain-containing protein [Acidobacteriia bacterium]|nr:cold shock domain-containing protein [Terriglobia bacterium]
MEKGTIKKLYSRFGFVENERRGGVYFDRRAIGELFDDLHLGDEVEFTIHEVPRGIAVAEMRFSESVKV